MNTITTATRLTESAILPAVNKASQKHQDNVLGKTTDRGDDLRLHSRDQIADLLRAERRDIESPPIAPGKNDLYFQLMMQARNKMVEAYQEIVGMQF